MDSYELFGMQDLAVDYYQVLRTQSRPRFCKVLWGVVLVVLFGFTCFMVYQLLRAYFEYSSYSQNSVSWKDNLTLPAITICNLNNINYTALQNLEDITEEELAQFDALMRNKTFYSLKNGSLHENLNFEDYAKFHQYEIDHHWALNDIVGNNIYEMMIGSFGSGWYYDEEGDQAADWEPYDWIFNDIGFNYLDLQPNDTYLMKITSYTEMGTCLELNDDGILVQTSSGQDGGFMIDLDGHVDGYLPSTKTRGFVIFFRNPDEGLLLNQGGYIINPDAETFYKLTAKHVTRLGPPHGSCENVKGIYGETEHHYESVRECKQRQKLLKMVKTCHCLPYYLADRLISIGKTEILDDYIYYAYTNDTPVAEERPDNWLDTLVDPYTGSIEDADPDFMHYSPRDWWWYYHFDCTTVQEVFCKSSVDEEVRNTELENCPEPCEYMEWGVEMHSSPFPPSEEYFNEFLKGKTWAETPNDQLTYDYVLKNLARVHIYYDDLKVSEDIQVKAYEPQNFIAEFGGTVDLFVGFSFFTVFQLIEILVATCIYKCKKKMEERNVK